MRLLLSWWVDRTATRGKKRGYIGSFMLLPANRLRSENLGCLAVARLPEEPGRPVTVLRPG